MEEVHVNGVNMKNGKMGKMEEKWKKNGRKMEKNSVSA